MEHITNIEIKNFKSIRHQKIEGCKRINVFVGKPNVGKSNIIEALSLFMLGNIFDVDLREILRFESYVNLFYNNNFSKTIEVNINENEVVKLEVQKKELIVSSSAPSMSLKLEIPFDVFKSNAWEYGEASGEYDSAGRMQVKKYAFKNDVEAFSLEYTKELAAPFGENLVDVIKTNDDFKKEVTGLFKSYALKYATDENGKIRIVKENANQEVVIFPYNQMSDTLRRLIFYKAAITSNRNTVLLFEEPESHMFPPYITKFTSDIIYEENKNQYFIATHSPYVLNNFLEDAKEDVAIFLVDYKDGETLIYKMSDNDMHDAYQFGHDFFMNLENFIPHNSPEHV